MSESEATYDVVVNRVVEAPVDQVWNAWRESERVQQWWGPTGFTCPLATMDFREGGTSLVCMRAPAEYGGTDMYSTWTYTRIVPHERIEYTFRFADKDGGKITPAEAGIPAGVPEDGHHVIHFRQLAGDRTEMTMVEHGYTTADARDMSRMGLEQTLDKLAESVK